ncbi:sulfur carrier protein ThiS [Sediminibacillus albus]|uniref:Sulfur carrier protein n=1 Tax=Sediminibacillus albus TaxID=407036 RepID=A0A1G8VSF8_9BACI|nr:sulfur carrier protein ThiS [Sediminibacillus albus]SDJ68966.1 sulfur carrier protein [Sediminibacillus albus]
MKLVINGEAIEVSNSIRTVSDLLKHFNLDQQIVIVELNKRILEKECHEQSFVADEDKIEIVNFVGGG